MDAIICENRMDSFWPLAAHRNSVHRNNNTLEFVTHLGLLHTRGCYTEQGCGAEQLREQSCLGLVPVAIRLKEGHLHPW